MEPILPPSQVDGWVLLFVLVRPRIVLNFHFMEDTKDNSSINPASVNGKKETDPKTTLEEQKLLLEIKELKTAWYKKPTFFVPTIGALSSLVILWATGFFDVRNRELNISFKHLTIENSKLEQTKKVLETDSMKLTNLKQSLKLQTERLTRTKSKLFEDSSALANSKNELEREANLVKQSLINLNTERSQIRKALADQKAELDAKKIQLAILQDSLDLANTPKITIVDHHYTTEKDVGIYVRNTGKGTAYFKNVNYIYKGKKIIGRGNPVFSIEILDAMGINEAWMAYYEKGLSDSIPKMGALGPDQYYAPLRVSPSAFSEYHAFRFRDAIKGLEIEIEYCSSNGKTHWAKHKF
jgi:hypothetical protein